MLRRTIFRSHFAFSRPVSSFYLNFDSRHGIPFNNCVSNLQVRNLHTTNLLHNKKDPELPPWLVVMIETAKGVSKALQETVKESIEERQQSQKNAEAKKEEQSKDKTKKLTKKDMHLLDSDSSVDFWTFLDQKSKFLANFRCHLLFFI